MAPRGEVRVCFVVRRRECLRARRDGRVDRKRGRRQLLRRGRVMTLELGQLWALAARHGARRRYAHDSALADCGNVLFSSVHCCAPRTLHHSRCHPCDFALRHVRRVIGRGRGRGRGGCRHARLPGLGPGWSVARHGALMAPLEGPWSWPTPAWTPEKTWAQASRKRAFHFLQCGRARQVPGRHELDHVRGREAGTRT